jgi:hypothetical protein
VSMVLQKFGDQVWRHYVDSKLFGFLQKKNVIVEKFIWVVIVNPCFLSPVGWPREGNSEPMQREEACI